MAIRRKVCSSERPQTPSLCGISLAQTHVQWQSCQDPARFPFWSRRPCGISSSLSTRVAGVYRVPDSKCYVIGFSTQKENDCTIGFPTLVDDPTAIGFPTPSASPINIGFPTSNIVTVECVIPNTSSGYEYILFSHVIMLYDQMRTRCACWLLTCLANGSIYFPVSQTWAVPTAF